MYAILMQNECSFIKKLDVNIFLSLLKGCGYLYGKVAFINKSLYRLKQASRSSLGNTTPMRASFVRLRSGVE